MTPVAHPDVDRWWVEYRVEGRRELRDRLIEHYASLVRAVAGQVARGLPQRVDPGDLIGYGTFGLIEAIDRFEPDRGFRFETYAMARIRGAILDELRSIDWVPRSVRAKAKAIERASATLEARLHRSPTDAEVAVALGTTEAKLAAAKGQIGMVGVVALDEQVGGDDRDAPTLGDTVVVDAGDESPDGSVEVEAMRLLLADAINRMPEREKIVLTLYYYEGLTLAEIGRVLDVTESRICQIHTKAVGQLRSRLALADREPA